MSEAKHTPGPWDVDEGDFSIYQLETGDQIAEMFDHQTPEEVEANARLMASAPDMSAEITRLREENARLREALKPFAGILKGNYSHQSDDMPIKAGANQYDLVFVFTLGDLRAAAAAIRGKVKDEAACPEPDEAP